MVDSTGIKVDGEGEWCARKQGVAKQPSPSFIEPMAIPWRDWRKIRIGTDSKPTENWAAEFTTSGIGNTPMLPKLLDQIPPEPEITSVTADGAFDTHRAMMRSLHSAPPQSSRLEERQVLKSEAVARNEILRSSKSVGRTIWQR